MMGLDIGTSGCKKHHTQRQFEICAGSYPGVSAVRSGGSHVLDANLVWQNVKQVMAESPQAERRAAD